MYNYYVAEKIVSALDEKGKYKGYREIKPAGYFSSKRAITSAFKENKNDIIVTKRTISDDDIEALKDFLETDMDFYNAIMCALNETFKQG